MDFDAANNRALLISRYGLDAQLYNTQYASVTWETCSLRNWLNSEFLRAAFTADEQSAICVTNVDNSRSQGHSGWNTNGGNNTQDRIFLLSYVEARRYFSSNDARKCAPTAYAIARGAYTNSSNQTDEGRAAGWWWLRSPGYYQTTAAFVNIDGALSHSIVDYTLGSIRPAFWLNLGSGIF